MGQENEDKLWNLYCAITANAFADKVGSFEDFKQRTMSTPQKHERSEPETGKVQIKKQIEKANKILSGFAPPAKGGGN